MHYTFANHRATLRRTRRNGTLLQRLGADLAILLGVERVTYAAAWISVQIDGLYLPARGERR